ncbi:hypothetical protein, partial [Aliidiomarina iranensis]
MCKHMLMKVKTGLFVLMLMFSVSAVAEQRYTDFYEREFAQLVGFYERLIDSEDATQTVIEEFQQLKDEWGRIYDNQFEAPAENSVECRFWLAFR